MSQPSQPIDPQQLRKRVLLFYFAAGANLVMAVWVMTAAGGQVAGGVLFGIIAIFLLFAGVNYYMARRFSKYLRRLTRQRPPPAQDLPK